MSKRRAARRGASQTRSPASTRLAPAGSVTAERGRSSFTTAERTTQLPTQARGPRDSAAEAVAKTAAPPRRLVWGFLAAGLAAVLLTYLRTLSPSLPTGDSGELITAAWVLGIPHPPGYPLYTMLGHAFALLPIGSAAQRLNLLSALLHVGSLVLVYLSTSRLLEQDSARPGAAHRWWRSRVAGAVGALLLAFSTAFWGYALVAEVFPLNSFFAALLLFLLLEWEQRPRRIRLLWGFALACGLAASNHHTIVLLAPAFLVLHFSGARRLIRERGRMWLAPRLPIASSLPLTLAVAAGLLLVGLLPYLYLPLAASRDPLLNWDDPSTMDGFVKLVTRADYGTFRLALQAQQGSRLEHLGLVAQFFLQSFTPLGCLLALISGWWLARHRPIQGLAILLAFLCAGPLFVAYANPSMEIPLWKGVLERFYILPSVPFGVAIGAGAYQLLQWAGRLRLPDVAARAVLPVAAAALLLLPAGAALAHFSTVDQSSNYTARNFGEDMLAPLEPGALFIMRGDAVTFSVEYLQFVEGHRRDVIALDMEKLKFRWYVGQNRRQHPEARIPFDLYDQGRTNSLKALIDANIGTRPVYLVGDPPEKDFRANFDVVRAGFADRLYPKGTGPERWSIFREKLDLLVGLRYPSRNYPETTFEFAISQDYGRLAMDVANILREEGRRGEAEALYRTSIRLAPGYSLPYKNLGLLLLETNAQNPEVVSLWEEYLRLNPNDPQAAAMRAHVDRIRSGRAQ